MVMTLTHFQEDLEPRIEIYFEKEMNNFQKQKLFIFTPSSNFRWY